jgi:FkbM family methyltransferase
MSVRKLLKRAIAVTLSLLPQRHLFNLVEQRRLPYALERLLAHGVKLGVVYDIGAYKGEWTQTMRHTLKGSAFVLFEGNAAHVPSLEQVGRYFIALLSDTVKTVSYYATGSTGDSYLQETIGPYDGVTPTTSTTVTLDALVREKGLPLPDFLKIDTQGSEIDVMRGAPQCLAHASLVLLECPLMTYNTGAPTIQDYLDFMKSQGFIPFEMTETHIMQDRLVQTDLLFLRATVHERLFLPEVLKSAVANAE